MYDIKGKFKRVGFFDKNLLELVGYIVDFIDIFLFGFIDVFNYMIFNKFDCDGKKLKVYKFFEDYRFFYRGVKFNKIKYFMICGLYWIKKMVLLLLVILNVLEGKFRLKLLFINFV